MTAKTTRKRPRRPSRETDHIELFGQKMRAVHERDQALEEVAKLRDAGKLREARAKLKAAETLHARIEALDEGLGSGPATTPGAGPQ
jgi:hypothetical protein